MTGFLRRVAALAKLRVISLLVVTGAAGAWKEAGGVPDGVVLLTVIAAGALAAAGANAVNQGLDADMDAVMRRTRTRPVPSEQMSARGAVITGAVLIALACALMLAGANALAAALTLAAAAVYVFVYTMLLKRRSWNNIVIGGAAGSVPPAHRLRGGRGRNHAGRALYVRVRLLLDAAALPGRSRCCCGRTTPPRKRRCSASWRARATRRRRFCSTSRC